MFVFFLTGALKSLPYNASKMANLHIKFFQNIANPKSIYIFFNVKGTFAGFELTVCNVQFAHRLDLSSKSCTSFFQTMCKFYFATNKQGLGFPFYVQKEDLGFPFFV